MAKSNRRPLPFPIYHVPFTILLATGVISVATALLRERLIREMADFEVYWRAGARAAAAQPLYRVEDEHYQFKYLPAFAVLAAPIAMLSVDAAKPVWFAASVVLLFLLISLAVRLLPERRKPPWLLSAAAVVVLGKFYGHELILGQVNILFGAAVAAALAALKRRRDLRAGALVAGAIVVKPYAVLFVPWLLAAGRTPAAAGAILGIGVALVLPIVLYGPSGTFDLHLTWWRTVSDSTAPNLLNQDNVSVAAMYAKWLGPGHAAASLATITGVALIGIAAFVISRRRTVAFPEVLEGALLLTLIPLLSPQGWDYVFLVSTPAIVCLVNYEASLPAALRVAVTAAMAVIGLSLFDVMGRAAYAAFMALSIISLCYFVVIAALTTLRIRQVA